MVELVAQLLHLGDQLQEKQEPLNQMHLHGLAHTRHNLRRQLPYSATVHQNH
jgi:hypothetical protein